VSSLVVARLRLLTTEIPQQRTPTAHFELLDDSRLRRPTSKSKSSHSPSQTHITTDGQSVSQSWCQAPPGAQDQIFVTVRQLRFYSSSSLYKYSFRADCTKDTASNSFRGNVLTAPLPDNGRLFLGFHYSGFQLSCHNICVL
jgi:hypothetical protein